MKDVKKLALACAVATSAVGGVSSAYGAIGLEEIVVTARKREESIQDVPVAVTAVTAETFARSAIVNFEEATALTPGFTTAPSSSSPTAPALSLRGSVQTDQLITVDPSVGVYLDGVYIARTYGIGVDLLDLRDVQVLKGPQGTLFGRNSTAGAMLLRTNDPELEEFTGSVSFTAGQDVTRYTGILNVPMGEKFAARFALQQSERDDYITNQANAVKPGVSEIGGSEKDSARVKLRFAPTDALDMVLSYEEFEADIKGPVRDQVWLSKGPVAYDEGDDTVSLSFDPYVFSDTETTTFVATYGADFGELKFTASTREWRNLREADYDGADLAVDPAIRPGRRHGAWGRSAGDQDNFELQLTTALFDDKLDLVTGINYFEESAELYDYSFGLDPRTQGFFYGGGSYVSQDTESLGAYAQGTYHINDVSNLTVGLRRTEDDKEAYIQGTPSSGVFTVLPSWDFDYMAANQFKLLDFFGITAPFGTKNPVTDILTPSETFSSTDWLVSYDYQVNDFVMVYAKASTGFRAGGFNGRGTPGNAPVAYDPEELLEFELGMKGDFLEGDLRTNIAIFSNETDEKQLTTIFGTASGTGTAVLNAGQSEAKGFEAEFTYLLHENWSVAGTYSYIDVEVTEMEDPNGNPLPSESFPLPQFVPENEWSLSLNYDQEFDAFRVAGTAMYHWIDEMYGNDKSAFEIVNETVGAGDFTPAEAAGFVDSHLSDAYGTLNLNVTVSTLDELYSATLWGKNVLDERAKQSTIAFVAGSNYQYSTATYTEPMTWGVTLKASF